MARLMLSAGMFSALAAAIAVRSRGLPSGSPPPDLAAIVISLIRRVKILPRLASSAPFLCLIVAHFEWPDMQQPQRRNFVCKRTQITRIRMRTNEKYSTQGKRFSAVEAAEAACACTHKRPQATVARAELPRTG